MVVAEDAPIVRDLLLSLEDCYHGAVKKIKISRRVRMKFLLNELVFCYYCWVGYE